ncbi:MAG: hypothetical protein QM673_05430 [Gordonia sp. (in: high G+C Gram-positive bacteria)]
MSESVESNRCGRRMVRSVTAVLFILLTSLVCATIGSPSAHASVTSVQVTTNPDKKTRGSNCVYEIIVKTDVAPKSALLPVQFFDNGSFLGARTPSVYRNGRVRTVWRPRTAGTHIITVRQYSGTPSTAGPGAAPFVYRWSQQRVAVNVGNGLDLGSGCLML